MTAGHDRWNDFPALAGTAPTGPLVDPAAPPRFAGEYGRFLGDCDRLTTATSRRFDDFSSPAADDRALDDCYARFLASGATYAAAAARLKAAGQPQFAARLDAVVADATRARAITNGSAQAAVDTGPAIAGIAADSAYRRR